MRRRSRATHLILVCLAAATVSCSPDASDEAVFCDLAPDIADAIGHLARSVSRSDEEISAAASVLDEHGASFIAATPASTRPDAELLLAEGLDIARSIEATGGATPGLLVEAAQAGRRLQHVVETTCDVAFNFDPDF